MEAFKAVHVRGQCFQHTRTKWALAQQASHRSLWPNSYKRYSALSAAHPASGGYVTYINRSVGPEENIESVGTVVVRGNVDADACIQAAGDVMVFGRLCGHVHAGCEGNRNASISALELRDAHLQIARVKTVAAARLTVPGPHTACIAQVGQHPVLQLLPLAATHAPATPAGIAKSFWGWLQWYPAAAAALITGAYALVAGAALLVAPKATLGLLFNTNGLEAGWIRLGGVLFATFGMQYLGTALVDWRTAHSSTTSSEGLPDMPFRPASPHGGSQNSNSSSIPPASGLSNNLSRAQQHCQHMSGKSSRTTESAWVPGDPAAKAAGDRTADAGQRQQAHAEPPTLGIYNQPPRVSTSGARASSSTGAPDQHYPAGVQHLGWLCSSTGFFEASVWSRLVLAVLFCMLVIARQCQPGLLLLAVLNLFGALGMMNALKQQWCLHVMGDLPAVTEPA